MTLHSSEVLQEVIDVQYEASENELALCFNHGSAHSYYTSIDGLPPIALVRTSATARNGQSPYQNFNGPPQYVFSTSLYCDVLSHYQIPVLTCPSTCLSPRHIQ